MSEQQELASEPIAIAKGLPWWRRAIRWCLMVLGVLFLILMLMVAKDYWFPAERDVRTMINDTMNNEFGPYSDELSGWTTVVDKQAYLMRVETQHELMVGKERKLLLGVMGYPVDDAAGAQGKLHYRLLMLDLSNKPGEKLSYILSTSTLDVNALDGFKSVQLEHLMLGPQLFGWQLSYETSDEGTELLNRELYLVDLAKSEVVHAGRLPVSFDNSGSCHQPRPYIPEPSAEPGSAEAASEVATEAGDTEPQPEMMEPCWKIKASYQSIAAKGRAMPSWKVTVSNDEGGKSRTTVGKVTIDPHSLQLHLSKQVQAVFDEPYAE